MRTVAASEEGQRSAWRSRERSRADRDSCSSANWCPLWTGWRAAVPDRRHQPGEIDDYKFIDFGGVRFDHVFLSMVAEVAAKYRVTSRMLMHGCSGGGHFAHRFFYLHPRRLAAVSIAAPGLVTLLDDSLPWWAGTRDFADRFGIDLDYGAMRDVAVHLVVGAKDAETWEITVPVDSPLWVEGADRAGTTRIERLTSLRKSFAFAGIETRFDTVPGVRHNGYQLLDAVRDFFADALLPK